MLLRDDRAVEIRAEADAVDAEMLDQVVGVADDVLERRIGQHASVGAQEAGGEIDADQAAALADRGELPVGQVARMRAERMRVRMGRDERRVAERGDVPKALLVQVRQVDERSSARCRP